MNSLLTRPGFRGALIAAGVALLVLLAAQVAGMVFMWLLGGSARAATPITLPVYAFWWSGEATVRSALYLGGGAGLLILMTPALFLLPQSDPRPLHGDAAWATRRDIRRAGLTGNHGIIVGRFGQTLLRHNGGRSVSPHVFLAAATGTGKTQGVMLPNAFTWPGSMVVTDIKGELYKNTGGYRAECGQEVIVLDFSPIDGRGHQYNPFFYVNQAPERIAGDVLRIATYLIHESDDPFWSNSAREVFCACALYFYGLKELPTIAKIRDLISIPGGFAQWCEQFVSDESNLVKHHPQCVGGFSTVANARQSPNTLGGFMLHLRQALLPLLNDMTAAVLSGNTFDLRELRTRRMSIYVTIRPQDRDQYAPIARLFFQQMVDVNCNVEFADLPPGSREVLIGLDEFAAIGKMPAIANGITTIRSYGLRLLVIVQSPAQLTSIYGRDDARTFTDNFGCAIFYTPGARDNETAEEISKLLGNMTVRTRSESRRKNAILEPNASTTTSQQRRALMLPQEVLSLKPDQAIIRVSGVAPIKAGKLLAATDPRFRKLARRTTPPPRLPINVTWGGNERRRFFENIDQDRQSLSEFLASVAEERNQAHQQTSARGQNQETLAPQAQADFHRPTNLDLANLNSAALDDFDFDFSGIEIPPDSMNHEQRADVIRRLLAESEQYGDDSDG